MCENWLCKHCEHYKGMEQIKGHNGKPISVTKCGDPQWIKEFEEGKDYLLHYASKGRPNWCTVKVDF